MTADLLGRPLDEVETQVMEAYRLLQSLSARSDAPPCVTANARHALAAVAQAVNDLGLEFEHLLDVDV